MAEQRITQEVLETVRVGTPNLRITQEVLETVRVGTPNLRATQMVMEVITVLAPVTFVPTPLDVSHLTQYTTRYNTGAWSSVFPNGVSLPQRRRRHDVWFS